MRSSTIVLAVGLLASPLALLAKPDATAVSGGTIQLVQYSTGAPEQSIHGRPLQDAPVPDPAPGIAPVDRVAGPGSRDLSAGPVNSTPFSAGPTSALQAGSPATSNGGAEADTTPNLGK